jgi:hypothetical protein
MFIGDKKRGAQANIVPGIYREQAKTSPCLQPEGQQPKGDERAMNSRRTLG